jgi:ABC-type multidrug transport system fused ATPase/permease subunit
MSSWRNIATKTMESLRWFARLAAHAEAGVGLTLAALLGCAWASVIPVSLAAYWVHTVGLGAGAQSEHALVTLTLMGLAVLLLHPLAAFTEARVEATWLPKLRGALRRKLLHHIHHAPLLVVDQLPRNYWVEEVTADLKVAEKFVLGRLPGLVRRMGTTLICFSLMLVIGHEVAVVPLGIILVSTFFAVQATSRRRIVDESRQAVGSDGLDLLEESIQGWRTVRSHGVEAYVQRRFDGKERDILESELSLLQSIGRLDALGTLSQCTGWVLSLVSLAALVHAGFLSTDRAIVVGLFAMLAMTQIRSTMQRFPHLYAFVESSFRLISFFDDESDRLANGRPQLLAETPQMHSVNASQLIIDSEETRLGPLDFRLRRGELWAISGHAGAGKSLLLEVLAGLRPGVRGQLALHDKNARVLWSSGDVTPHLPSACFAYVEQSPYLITGTLRENLAFGNTQRLSDTILWDALERVNLYDFARTLGGLDAGLLDQGRHFRKGIRYRIALARAFLLNRPFLLLDEPFAPHDDATIAWIADTLRLERKRAGVLVVTRSLPKFFSVDGLIEMEANGMSPEGSHTISLRETAVQFGHPL